MNARPQVLQFGHLADPRGTLHHGCNGCGPRAACAGSSTLAGSPAAADQVLQKIAGWGANSIRIPLDPEPSSSAARCVLEVLGEAETVYLSVFVLAELLAGLKGGQRERRNREGLKAFMAAPSVKLLFATDIPPRSSLA